MNIRVIRLIYNFKWGFLQKPKLWELDIASDKFASVSLAAKLDNEMSVKVLKPISIQANLTETALSP